MPLRPNRLLADARTAIDARTTDPIRAAVRARAPTTMAMIICRKRMDWKTREGGRGCAKLRAVQAPPFFAHPGGAANRETKGCDGAGLELLFPKISAPSSIQPKVQASLGFSAAVSELKSQGGPHQGGPETEPLCPNPRPDSKPDHSSLSYPPSNHECRKHTPRKDPDPWQGNWRNFIVGNRATRGGDCTD